LLFIIGWAYADTYFDVFGISTSGLDRDLAGAFYIYALWALRDGWLLLIVLLASLAVIAVLLAIFRHSSSFWQPFTIFVIAAFVAASLIFAFWLGQSRAASQVPQLLSSHYQTFRRVIVTAKKDTGTAQFLAEKNAGESKDCLRKIYMDRKHIYLYPGYEDLKGGIPPVYIVPLEEIAAIEIVRNPGLCHGG
jgi:hypothetical protein